MMQCLSWMAMALLLAILGSGAYHSLGEHLEESKIVGFRIPALKSLENHHWLRRGILPFVLDRLRVHSGPRGIVFPKVWRSALGQAHDT